MSESNSEDTARAGVAEPRSSRRARGLARRLFWGWVVVSFLGAGSLGIAHTFALPDEAIARPELAAAIGRSRSADERGKWLALHVLYSRCRCSERTLTHLFARRPVAFARERVVLVGAHAAYEASARRAGFAVEVLAPDQLEPRYHLAGAPIFVVADPAGTLRYVGGYTARKQGLDNQDAQILTRLVRGDQARPLPMFGCAVSRRLKQMLDPLGLRTNSDEEG